VLNGQLSQGQFEHVAEVVRRLRLMALPPLNEDKP
jgi:hypothetical protein